MPTRPVSPQDKGNVEAGVKIVTNWVIHKFADRRFADLDELNDAVVGQVSVINDRTPFRGLQVSRRELFDKHEKPELLALPDAPWQPVTWKKSKVNRDYHIEIATVKYSVPYLFAGRHVDVKITGERLSIMCDGKIIAAHTVPARKHVFVTDPDHGPEQHQQSSDLWTRAYFVRQAHKVGPATVAAITSVLDARPIEAQGYRACQNILGLARNDNKALLESACQQLVDPDSPRAVSYTAVKHRLTVLRAQATARPVTTPATPPASNQQRGRPAGQSRDTSGAHLAGPEHFSLDALRTRDHDTDQDGTR